MAGVDPESQFMGMIARQLVALERRRQTRSASFKGARIGFGIEFHAIGPKTRSPIDRCWFRLYEHTHPHTRRVETINDLTQCALRRVGRPASFARHLTGANGNEGALIWLDLLHHLNEPWAGVPLDVVFNRVAHRAECIRNGIHIVGPDMPPILAGMHGDTRRASRDAHLDSFEDARGPTVARITQRGDLIDVDAQPNHEASLSLGRRPCQQGLAFLPWVRYT